MTDRPYWFLRPWGNALVVTPGTKKTQGPNSRQSIKPASRKNWLGVAKICESPRSSHLARPVKDFNRRAVITMDTAAVGGYEIAIHALGDHSKFLI